MTSEEKLEQIKKALASYRELEKKWIAHYQQEVAKTRNHQIASERYSMVMAEGGETLVKEIQRIIS
jgi:riboflavin biosynthesis pyrimidine reductase